MKMRGFVLETLELVGVFLACVWGITISSTSYAILKLKTRKIPPTKLNSTLDSDDYLLSIVIAAFNEADSIVETVESVVSNTKNPKTVEIIIVDASSTDKTKEVAQNISSSVPIRVVASASGRGYAMIQGAKEAKGSCYLFLHADASLPYGYDTLLKPYFINSSVIAASFKFGVSRKDMGHLIGMGTVEWFANFRAYHFQLPYGDQGIAISRYEYDACGGFPSIPMMEDFELIAKLRKKAITEGKTIEIIPAISACSPRRWIKNGVLKNTLLNQVFVLAYVYLGWTPEKVYSWYYGKKV